MSSQAYCKNDEMMKSEMTITEEALFVEELLQRRCTDAIEISLTIEDEASIIVEELLAAMLIDQNIFANQRSQVSSYSS
eukprot:scaffold59_cov133-Skeletonema_dohrnii-CCMP3373.AAC.18